MTFDSDDEPPFTLESSLAQLEATDPAVAKAAAKLEQVKQEIVAWDPHKVRNRADGRVHFSDLKALAVSAKQYAHACRYPRARSRPMTVGAVADRLVFGFGRAAVYDGVRRGKEWESFKRARADAEICIQPEWVEAKGAADAVLADPVARDLLKAPRVEYQRVMQWEAYGLPFAAGIPGQRGGVDLIAGRTLGDLKITADVEPLALMRHAWTMLWPQQLACYVDGARSLGIDVDDAALICVEATAPHDVVVLTFDESDFVDGRKSLVMWTDRLKACEAEGVWPGHVQSRVKFERPAWAREDAVE